MFPDVFDPEFAETAQRISNERCAPRKDDPWLLGWFTDNELRWGPDWRRSDELLTLFLALPADSPIRRAAISLLRQRHGDIAEFNAVRKTGFASWDELTGAGPIKPPVVRTAVYSQNQAKDTRPGCRRSTPSLTPIRSSANR